MPKGQNQLKWKQRGSLEAVDLLRHFIPLYIRSCLDCRQGRSEHSAIVAVQADLVDEAKKLSLSNEACNSILSLLSSLSTALLYAGGNIVHHTSTVTNSKNVVSVAGDENTATANQVVKEIKESESLELSQLLVFLAEILKDVELPTAAQARENVAAMRQEIGKDKHDAGRLAQLWKGTKDFVSGIAHKSLGILSDKAAKAATDAITGISNILPDVSQV